MQITIKLKHEGQSYDVKWIGSCPPSDLYFRDNHDWMTKFIQGLPEIIVVQGADLKIPKRSLIAVKISIDTIIDGWREEWDRPLKKPRKPICVCSQCGAPIYSAELFRGPVCPVCGHWC